MTRRGGRGSGTCGGTPISRGLVEGGYVPPSRHLDACSGPSPPGRPGPRGAACHLSPPATPPAAPAPPRSSRVSCATRRSPRPPSSLIRARDMYGAVLATRAPVRCWHTIASNAHRSPRRDSFARGSAAMRVSWPTRDRSLYTGSGARSPRASSAASPAARGPAPGSRCRPVRLRNHSAGTTGPARRPGAPAPRGRASVVGR